MMPVFEVPHIGGAFSNWKWNKMFNMIEFCMENDPEPPNFIKNLIERKEVRAQCGEPHYETMNEHEIAKVARERMDYYQ